jgi:hypothetical protein
MKKETLKHKIIELKNTFDKQQNKLKPNHLITRRIGSFHGFLSVVTLLLVGGIVLTKASLQITTDETFINISSVVIGSIVIFLILSVKKRIFIQADSNKKDIENKLFKFNCAALILYILVLITYKTNHMVVLLGGVSLLVYLGCYFSNKQHGYTRGWARNQTYSLLLESLEWEVDQLDGKNNISSNLKLEELSSKFTRIIEAQLHERQRDIIGDYLSTNDAAFSWIKSIKK